MPIPLQDRRQSFAAGSLVRLSLCGSLLALPAVLCQASGVAATSDSAFLQDLAGSLSEVRAGFALDRALEQTTYRLRWDELAGWACKNGRGASGLNPASPDAVRSTGQGECGLLDGASLAGADIPGANLKGASLRRADLRGGRLAGADLLLADLSGADLSGADLRGAALTRANMPLAVLAKADLREAKLFAVYLASANLRGADLTGARFREPGDLREEAFLAYADLSGADLSGTDLNGAYLLRANLAGANMREARLNGAHLAKADLRGADLTGAVADFTYFQGAEYDERTRLPFSDKEAGDRGMVKKEAGTRRGTKPAGGGISAERFHAILDRAERVFAPIFLAKSQRLRVNREWDNDQVQADGRREEDDQGFTAVLRFAGGLPRHPAMTEDAFTLVVCHELGHHIGGAPLYGGASVEGQADYYAALKCLRVLWKGEANSGLLVGRPVHPKVLGLCSQAFRDGGEAALCERIAMTGYQNSLFLAKLRRVADPSFDTPDPTKVDRLFLPPPSPQCRLDTYLAAAVCNAPLSEDVSSQDPSTGACTAKSGHSLGLRPACWYAP
ncbi:MAG: pentapeptide repeat-containing protein [Elusimicrobia bacterium]|nr:pentapeptide repeat-containing protein [Elusimicrobiota bacterium]